MNSSTTNRPGAADRFGMEERAGGCLCGSVRYRLSGPLRPVVYCHCTQCRHQTGHFLAATAVALGHFHLEREGALRWYSASATAQRGFCAQCGSFLFWKPASGTHISLAPGSLDDDRGLAADCHIYVQDKGVYYTLGDGLPQHAADSALPEV